MAITYEQLRRLATNHDIAEEDADGQYKLGIGFEMNRRFTMAVQMMKKSAEQGYVPAQNRLAWYYNNGQGVEKNLEMSFYWYQKCAIQGDHEGMFECGRRYIEGIGVTKDEKQGLEYLHRSNKANAQKLLKKLAIHQNIQKWKETILTAMKKEEEQGFKWCNFYSPFLCLDNEFVKLLKSEKEFENINVSLTGTEDYYGKYLVLSLVW